MTQLHVVEVCLLKHKVTCSKEFIKVSPYILRQVRLSKRNPIVEAVGFSFYTAWLK